MEVVIKEGGTHLRVYSREDSFLLRTPRPVRELLKYVDKHKCSIIRED